MTNADNKNLPIAGFVGILLILGVAMLAVALDISSAHRELKISPYDSDIPNWLNIAVSIIAASAVMMCFKRYLQNNVLAVLFFTACSTYLLFILFSRVSVFVAAYIAFNGPTETQFREIKLESGEIISHKGWFSYKGVINNKGYIAEVMITKPLYQMLETSASRPCVGVMVQKRGANERILLSHILLDVSDVVRC